MAYVNNQDFEGQYFCSLDTKNRVSIPSGIRRKFIPEAENTIVFTRGFEMQNLYAYPLNEWKRLTLLLRKLNPLEKKVRDFIRLFVGVAHEGSTDAQGRIIIPERILKLGQIEKDMILMGSLNKIEIWNPQVYEKYLSKENINLSDLAEQISFTDMFFDKGE